MKDAQAMSDDVRRILGDKLIEVSDQCGWALAIVDVGDWFDACAAARENLGLDYLANLTAIDRMLKTAAPPAQEGQPAPEPSVTYAMELVAHAYSTSTGDKLALKCKLNREKPTVRSVAEHWSAANWYEREAGELFGIEFAGHPDMRPLLLPENWEGYPFRKDYVEPD